MQSKEKKRRLGIKREETFLRLHRRISMSRKEEHIELTYRLLLATCTHLTIKKHRKCARAKSYIGKQQ